MLKLKINYEAEIVRQKEWILYMVTLIDQTFYSIILSMREMFDNRVSNIEFITQNVLLDREGDKHLRNVRCLHMKFSMVDPDPH